MTLRQAFWNNRLFSFFALTLAFGAIYALNNTLTAPLMVVPGAHLIHLPSGFKFLLALVFGWIGAMSIFTVSLLAGVLFYFPDQWLICLQLATACSLAPVLARIVALEQLGINHDLSNLTFKRLLFAGLFFSALNTSFNQLVLYWNHVIEHFLEGWAVMFTGDVTGVMMVLSLLKLGMKFFNTRSD